MAETKDVEVTTLPEINNLTQDPDPSLYTYEGNDCIYTDPATGFQCRYQWDSKDGKWIQKKTEIIGETPEYEKIGDTYMYKDQTTGKVLIWDLEKKEWKSKVKDVGAKRKNRNADEEFDSSDESEDERQLEQKKADINHHVEVGMDGIKTYRDPSDGTVFEWDEDKKAWFPKLDDEFLARYQLNYGARTISEGETEVKKQPQPEVKEIKKPSEPNWFEVDDSKNTKVYVSNLPLSTTEDSFIELMSKYGLIEKDLETQKMKIKLYRDENGEIKGDGLCTYIKVI